MRSRIASDAERRDVLKVCDARAALMATAQSTPEEVCSLSLDPATQLQQALPLLMTAEPGSPQERNLIDLCGRLYLAAATSNLNS